MSSIAYLSLGSNLGNREANLREAISRLKAAGRIIGQSGFYETEPVEVIDQPWFVNCVVALETDESPNELVMSVLGVEREMGRQRSRSKGPRTIDIDVLLHGDVVVHSPQANIPHPAMHQRRFVLEPLVEIAPSAWHPVLKRTAQELLAELLSGQTVRKIEKSG